MPDRWLVTGGTGQVGKALSRLALKGVEIAAPTRAELDLARLPDDLSPFLDGVSAIINCGAYTAVDRAEEEPALAHSVNAAAPGRLADAAARANIPLIHVSTDYVFPPDRSGPWSPDDTPAPASVYGVTKLKGEQAVRSSGVRHAIIRTAWVISADGRNFLKTMLALGAQHSTLRVVADQHGSPTHAGDLANALSVVALAMTEDSRFESGTWHCTNAGNTTWHGLANCIFESASARGMPVPKEVLPIPTRDYPTPARRPMDSRLDCSTLQRDFGLTLRPWQEAVGETVGILAGKGAPA